MIGKCTRCHKQIEVRGTWYNVLAYALGFVDLYCVRCRDLRDEWGNLK